MLNNVNTNVERIIAKIDNDFNPDGSDWIPRVVAWTIDAMSQLNILRTVPKTRKLVVKDRIARSACPIGGKGFKVYDENGCEIPMVNGSVSIWSSACSCDSPTGEQPDSLINQCDCDASNRVSVVDTGYDGHDTYGSLAITNNTIDPTKKHTVVEEIYSAPRRGINHKNYVLIGSNTIELNYDAKYITVTSLEVETEYSDYYKCDIPIVPNNGILIEAIGFYCMYKMLCRGMKHPVFNLNASQYGTNPYYQWQQLKDKAKAGVIIDAQLEHGDNGAWRSYFFDYTFPSR